MGDHHEAKHQLLERVRFAARLHEALLQLVEENGDVVGVSRGGDRRVVHDGISKCTEHVI